MLEEKESSTVINKFEFERNNENEQSQYAHSKEFEMSIAGQILNNDNRQSEPNLKDLSEVKMSKGQNSIDADFWMPDSAQKKKINELVDDLNEVNQMIAN